MDHMVRFYESLFPNLPPLIFDFLKRKREKVVIYTDASCSLCHYGLGIIIIIDGSRWYLNSFAPQWILDSFKECNTSLKIINQLELLVILCTVLTFGECGHGRTHESPQTGPRSYHTRTNVVCDPQHEKMYGASQ